MNADCVRPEDGVEETIEMCGGVRVSGMGWLELSLPRPSHTLIASAERRTFEFFNLLPRDIAELEY
jgi:hypothetical protein